MSQYYDGNSIETSRSPSELDDRQQSDSSKSFGSQNLRKRSPPMIVTAPGECQQFTESRPKSLVPYPREEYKAGEKMGNVEAKVKSIEKSRLSAAGIPSTSIERVNDYYYRVSVTANESEKPISQIIDNINNVAISSIMKPMPANIKTNRFDLKDSSYNQQLNAVFENNPSTSAVAQPHSQSLSSNSHHPAASLSISPSSLSISPTLSENNEFHQTNPGPSKPSFIPSRTLHSLSQTQLCLDNSQASLKASTKPVTLTPHSALASSSASSIHDAQSVPTNGVKSATQPQQIKRPLVRIIPTSSGNERSTHHHRHHQERSEMTKTSLSDSPSPDYDSSITSAAHIVNKNFMNMNLTGYQRASSQLENGFKLVNLLNTTSDATWVSLWFKLQPLNSNIGLNLGNFNFFCLNREV